jgi:hypothetical protein
MSPKIRQHERQLGGPAQLSVRWEWHDALAVTVWLYAQACAPEPLLHTSRLSMGDAPSRRFRMPAHIVGAQERFVEIQLEYDTDDRLQLRADIPLDTNKWFRDVLGTRTDPDEPDFPIDPDGPDAPDSPGWSPFHQPQPARGFSIANPRDRYRLFEFLWLRPGSDNTTPGDRRATSHFIQVAQAQGLPVLPLLAALDADATWAAKCVTASAYVTGGKARIKDAANYPFVSSLSELDETWRSFPTVRHRLLQLRGEVSLEELGRLVAEWDASPSQIVDAKSFQRGWIRVWQSVIALILVAGDAAYAASLVDVLRMAAFLIDLHRHEQALTRQRERQVRLMAALVVPTCAVPPDNAFGAGNDGSLRVLGIGELQAIYKDRESYVAGPISRTSTVLRGERWRTSMLEEDARIERIEEHAAQTAATEQRADHRRASGIEDALRATIESGCHERDFNDLKIVYNDIYMPQSVSGNWSDSGAEKLRDQSRVAQLAQEITRRATRRIAERVDHMRSVLLAQRRQSEMSQDVDNRDAETHLNGLYRWLIKRSRLVLQDEGRRLVLEFLLPNPASELVDAADRPAGVAVQAPETLDARGIRTPADIKLENYLALAGAYGISCPPPPSPYRRLALTLSGQASEAQGTIHVPDGFVPANAQGPSADGTVTGTLNYLISNQADPLVCIVGECALTYGGSGKSPKSAVSAPAPSASCTMVDPFQPPSPLPPATPCAGTDAKVAIDPSATEVLVCAFSNASSYRITVSFMARDNRHDERLQSWQQAIYDLLLDACVGQRQRFRQAWMARVQQLLQPSERESLVNELQRKAIDLLVSRYRQPPGVAASAPPRVRTHLDEAFQWRQMAYAFFPWGTDGQPGHGGPHWHGLDSDTSPGAALLHAFLAAGSARVLVPVMPGYEFSVLYYLRYGCLWRMDGGITPLPEPFLGVVTDLIHDETLERHRWWIEESTALEVLQHDDALPVIDWHPPIPPGATSAQPRSSGMQEEPT